MEEEATQPATQLVIDPRRYGEQHSGMSDDDLMDVFCILHPITMPACIAVSSIHSKTPEHTINASSAARKVNVPGIQIHSTTGPINTLDVDHAGENGTSTIPVGISASPGSFELAAQGITSCDIALRLSATTKSPVGGFYFGRHAHRCDFVLGQDDPRRRISNVHFRIYLTEHGIVMLEDSSTNGTLVDNKIIRSKNAKSSSRHTIENGSMISFIPATPGEEVIKFVVRLPQRQGVYEDLFDQQLQAYFARIKDGLRLRELQIEAEAGGPRRTAGEAPDIFMKENVPPKPATSSVPQSRKRKTWHGGEKYNVLEPIGKGAFATVYLINTKFEGTLFACKELEKRRFIKNGVLDQKVENEMKIMSKIKHPNIVQLLEHIDYFEYLYLIMEYVPNGDLGSFLAKDHLLSEHAGKTMTVQLLSALDYIHANGITHRDVKPDNILIQSMDPFHVKLTDFGLSKMVEDDETFLRTFCGTLLYCAPEVYTEYREYDAYGRRTNRGHHLLPQQYSKAIDVWSLGAVLFYSLSGLPPFPAKNGTTHQELLNRIMTTELDTSPLFEAKLSMDSIVFICGMLQRDPARRRTIQACEIDPWLEGYIELEEDLDEVDMVGNPDDALQQGASQLSLKDDEKLEIDDSMGSDDFDTVVTPTKRVNNAEIPSSFPSTESSDGESLLYLQQSSTKPRLFGEIDPAALRSSGVIAHGNLNLALSELGESGHHSSFDSGSADFASTIINTNATVQKITAMTDEHANPRGAKSDMSLFGAESMVGNLHMGSPSPAATNASSPRSPQPMLPPPMPKSVSRDDRPAQSPHVGNDDTSDGRSQNLTTSVLGRRQIRDETDGVDARSQMKRPATNRAITNINASALHQDALLVSTEQSTGDNVSTSRLISGVFSEKMLWDPRDRSTHVLTGQMMTNEEYAELTKKALALQEPPFSNAPSFSRLLSDLRDKGSDESSEAEAVERARSAPLQKQKVGIMHTHTFEQQATKDKLLLDVAKPVSVDLTHPPSASMVPAAIEGNDEKQNRTARSASVPAPSPQAQKQRTYQRAIEQGRSLAASQSKPTLAVIDVLDPPSADALARFTSTNDSHMPPLTFEVLKPVTVWGRGEHCTVRYWNTSYDHVSKYHFKLALWGPETHGASESARNGSFYISAQRYEGILINGCHLKSTPPGTYNSASLYWAKLHHNDIITISNRNAVNHLLFECYTGQSKISREADNHRLEIYPIGEQQAQLDKWVLEQQVQMSVERQRLVDADPNIASAERNNFNRVETELREKLQDP